MQLEHSFTVPLGIDEAWRVLVDIGSIASCMPGSTIEDAVPDKVTGALKVKLGPLNLTYRGTTRLMEFDESAHRAVVHAKGEDARNGSAAATVVATLTGSDEGSTAVALATDLDVTGKPAQFGQNVMNDVGIKLVGQFAANLAKAIDKGTLPVQAEPATEDAVAGSAPTDADDLEPAASSAPETPAEPAPIETSPQPEPQTRPRPRPGRGADAAAPADPENASTGDPTDAVDLPDVGDPLQELADGIAATAQLPAAYADPAVTSPEEPPAAPAAAPPDADEPGSTPSYGVPGGVPTVEPIDPNADAAPSGDGRGSNTPPPAQRPARNPLADAARPALARGLAPVALAVVFVWSTVRRRRNR